MLQIQGEEEQLLRNFCGINKKRKFQKDITWLMEPSSDTKLAISLKLVQGCLFAYNWNLEMGKALNGSLDAGLLEWQKAGMNGFDGSLGMARVSSIFLVNWVSQLQCIMYGKNRMQGSLLECLELQIWSLIKSNISFAISLIWWGTPYQQMKTKGSKELGGLIT